VGLQELFGKAVDDVKSKVGSALNNKHAAAGLDLQGQSDLSAQMNGIYTTSDYTNWYRQRPYAFIFTNKEGVDWTFYLPIAPSNININTHFATNVITTMYGTVEEHSEQRYYDITIAGTTAMMPRYYTMIDEQIGDIATVIGRSGPLVKSNLSDKAGGFFKRQFDLIEATANKISDAIGGEKKITTGVNLKRTGYVAFHNFYKFLLAYKKDTASAGIRVSSQSGGSAHPLRFVNYKDNNQYDVSVQQFQLTRNSDEPFLYNYNIVLRAYNLRSANAAEISLDIENRKTALGLDGIKTSLLAKIANTAADAKRAAYSAIAVGKGFGL